MSSVYVREKFTEFLENNSTEKILDLSGQSERMRDFLTEAGISPQDTWVGIEFIGDEELPITVGSQNLQGYWRETGGIYIHAAAMAKIGVAKSMLARAEALRELIRSQRIDNIVIESVTPPNTGAGAALQFEGGWVTASFIVAYYRDYAK